MKKKLILLPLLMLALGACGSSTVASSTTSTTSTPTSTTTSTTSETTSEAPVADTNVYRIVGTVQENAWTANDDEFLMTKDADANIFTIEGIDMFVDDEWCITINGDWAGQLGFTGSTNLTVIDTATTQGEGGGFAVKNFKTLTDGNYDIELNTGLTPRTLTITRVGDPIDVPVVEEDPGEWHLVGTMNEWAVTDLTYALAYDETSESYKGSFELEADAMFKVINADDSTWTYARGSANVETEDPVPAWLDITSDAAVKILDAGTYDIEFFWVASVGATINGVITIEQQDPNALPEGYTTISAILAEAEVNKVYKTRGVLVGINGGAMFIEDNTGAAINVYFSGAIKDTLLVGNVVDVEGPYAIYNLAGEIAATSVVLFAESAVTPVEPVVIASGAELTARMGTDYSLSGQLVRLNGVTVGPVGTPSSNNYNITFDSVVVIGYSFFSLAYENASAGRTAINTLITSLNTNTTTFDIIGVLYSSNSTGVWKLGLPTTSYVVVPA